MNEKFPGNDGIFQQDNAPCHKAITIRNWLLSSAIEVMECPSYSPDLASIENLWAIMNTKLYLVTCNSKVELNARAQEIWSQSDEIQEICRNLVEGILHRIVATVSVKGGAIKYYYFIIFSNDN